MGYKKLQGITRGYRGLQRVARGYRELEVRKGLELERVTGSYRK